MESRNRNISEFMKTRIRNTNDRVSLFLTYYTQNLKSKDEFMKSVFNDSLHITAYRKGKSMKEHLVASSFNSATKRPPARYKCTRHCKRSRYSTFPFTWESLQVGRWFHLCIRLHSLRSDLHMLQNGFRGRDSSKVG